jgi:hypothetical protein
VGVGGDKIRLATARSPSSPVTKPASRVARPFAGAYQQGARAWVGPVVGVACVTGVTCVARVVGMACVTGVIRGAGACLREARVVEVCVWAIPTPGVGV